jgi:hypothetical protein
LDQRPDFFSFLEAKTEAAAVVKSEFKSTFLKREDYGFLTGTAL